VSGAGVIFGYFEKFTSSRFPNSNAPYMKIQSRILTLQHSSIVISKGISHDGNMGPQPLLLLANQSEDRTMSVMNALKNLKPLWTKVNSFKKHH
jgi:hypothetical protein